MNTSTLKIIGYYATGGAIGGVIGHFVGRLIVLKMAMHELGKIQFGVDTGAEEGDHTTVIEVNETTVTEIEEKTVKPKKVKKLDYTTYSAKRKDWPDLQLLASKYNGDDVKNADITEDGATVAADAGVFVISFDDFTNDRMYEKVVLSFYEDDDTLADPNDKIISKPEGILGIDALVKFGELSEDPNVVYVRNTHLGIDYEVIRLHKSYSETVLGNLEEPKKKRGRKTRKEDAHTEEDDSED